MGPRACRVFLAFLLLLAFASGSHAQQKVIITVAGTGVTGFSGDGAPGPYTAVTAGGIVYDEANGVLYFADQGNHRIRRIQTDGTVTTYAGGLEAFAGDGGPASQALFDLPSDLAIDIAGNLYIADTGNNRIRKISPQGIVTTVAGNGTAGYSGDGGPATEASIDNPRRVAVDASGNIYIGSSPDHHSVRMVSASTGIISRVAGTGVFLEPGYNGDGIPGTSAKLYYPSGMVVDSSGNLLIADRGNCRIRKLSNGIISTIAGTGTCGFGGDGGPAVSALLSSPVDVAVDSSGNIFIAERGRIRVVNSAGVISTYAGDGSDLFSGDGGTPTSAGISPSYIELTANFLYFSEHSRIRRVQAAPTNNPVPVLERLSPPGDLGFSGAFDLTVYGRNFVPGSVVRWNGADRATRFVSATHLVASMPATDLNPSTATVTVFNPTALGGGGTSASLPFTVYRALHKPDGFISTFAGTGTAGYGGDGGPAVDALLNLPGGMARDSAGNLFVADRGNHRIRKIDPSGIITTVAGNGIAGFSGDGGSAVLAQLNTPFDVSVDAAGNVYIADTLNHRVRKVDSSGGITTVAGTGVKGFGGDGGPATSALLNLPNAVAVDGAGNAYLNDADNRRIRKIASGIITTIAGNGIAGGDFGCDGGPAALVPVSGVVAVDTSGNIHIGGRVVTASGMVTRVAGGSNGIVFNLGDGGAAVQATVGVKDVTFDSAANMYIADYFHRVRKVNTLGAIVTYAGNGTASFSGDGGLAVDASLNSPESVDVDPVGNVFIADTQNHRIRVVRSTCVYTLSALSATVSPVAGTGSVTVTTADGCPWTVVNYAPWITLSNAGATRTGTGTVTYGYQDNPGPTLRKGVLVIAGQDYVVTQSAPTVCSYSLSATAASLPSSAGNYSVSVSSPAGCAWTATSSASWITITSGSNASGSGAVNYSVTANPGSAPRSATIAIAGQTFSVTQAGSTAVEGTVTAGAANGAPGAIASVPVLLLLEATVNLDSLSFGVSVTAQGQAPALTSNLAFTNSTSMPAPTVVDNGAGPGLLSVNWSNLSPPIGGTLMLGTISVPIPSSATAGQAYTVHVTGASGSLTGTAVLVTPGIDATIVVGDSYLVGDTAPRPSVRGDLNGDGKYDNALEFGDGILDNFDLILALRAVTRIPGYTAAECTDRFDAMDSSPSDTAARGGNGVLDNLDLVATLRRVVNLDTSRPKRAPRGLACTAMFAAPLDLVGGEPAGAIELGPEQVLNNGGRRIPVYLNAGANDLALKALSFGLGLAGDAEGRLQFAAGAVRPSMIDDGVSGKLSIAWLEEIEAKAGERLLLGYVEVPADAVAGFGAVRLQFFRVVANSKEDGKRLLLTRPAPPLEVR